MGVVGDVIDALQKLPWWKRLGDVPDRLEILEGKVAELAAQLEPAPGRRCEGCGHLTLRLWDSRWVGEQRAKYLRQTWHCQNEACRREFDLKA